MGEYLSKGNSTGEEINTFELIAMAKRQNFSFDEMKEISFVSLLNVLFSSVQSDEKEATQNDIDTFF